MLTRGSGHVQEFMQMQHAYSPNGVPAYWPAQPLPRMPMMPAYYQPDIAALSRQQQVILLISVIAI